MERMSQRNLENEVLEYLRWNPNSRPSDIANALGVSPRLIRAVLARLRRKGLVYRTSRGYIARILDESGEHVYTERSAIVTSVSTESISAESTEPSATLTESETRDELRDRGSEALAESSTQLSEPQATAQSVSIADSCYSQLNELLDRVHRMEKILRELVDYLTIALQSIAIGDRESLHRVLEYLQDVAEELSNR